MAEKKRDDVVEIVSIWANDPREDSVRYVVQAWRVVDFSFLDSDPEWRDEKFGYASLSEAIRHANHLREQYAKVRIVKRTITNEVVA